MTAGVEAEQATTPDWGGICLGLFPAWRLQVEATPPSRGGGAQTLQESANLGGEGGGCFLFLLFSLKLLYSQLLYSKLFYS